MSHNDWAHTLVQNCANDPGIVPLKRQQIHFNSLAFHDCGKCILLEVLYSLVLYKFFPIDDQNKIFVYKRSISL